MVVSPEFVERNFQPKHYRVTNYIKKKKLEGNGNKSMHSTCHPQCRVLIPVVTYVSRHHPYSG